MSVAGLSYQRLVPATVLPPEDPSRSAAVRRTVRDWVVDSVLFVLSLGLGILFAAVNSEEHSGSVPPLPMALDIVLGHRISLLALHAGGLQLRSDLPWSGPAGRRRRIPAEGHRTGPDRDGGAARPCG